MAARKKESEGIMLLSVYNDEDDEMEDAEEDDNAEQRQQPERGEVAAGDRSERAEDDPRDASDGEDGGARVGSERMAASDSGHESTPQLTPEGSTPGRRGEQAPPPPLQQHPQQEVAVSVEARRRRRRMEMLSIVDYAHDEVAMSPEAEEGEIDSSSYSMLDERFQMENGDYEEKPTQEAVQVLSPTSQDISLSSGHIEPSQPDVRNVAEAQPIEVEDSSKASEDVDPLDKFLPPPPTAKCSEELQERVRKFIAYKRAGKSFNAEVRNRKDYRNPDFLLHSVRYQDIDQIGSCFRKEVFDPHGYDPSDYCDVLEVDMKREAERKEQERKKSQQVEFVSSGVQAGAPGILPKVSVPVAGIPTAASGGLRPSDPAARDGRHNKKSKWDKVDGDRKNPLPSGAQESVSTVAAHAAILSAANAGAGYTAFAQQRRREAEERRSGEKKLDRRS